ncbi:MAG: hypothetical protein ACE5I7_18080, partial [Candidatus Binatia bacterium]
KGPRITGGGTNGSTKITVSGIAEPNCTPTPILVFECGADGLCDATSNDDIPLALVSVTQQQNGDYFIVLVNPLQAGQRIFVTDGCTDPSFSLPAVVTAPAVAPLLSSDMLILLVAILSLVGLLGLSRLRWSR